MGGRRPVPWTAWAAVGLLAGSCCLLALLEYRWITEFSQAERQRLHEQLQSGLGLLGREFNDRISASCAALVPSRAQIDEMGVERAYAARYASWRGSHRPLFQMVALAIPDGRALTLKVFDQRSGQFRSADWPSAWSAMRDGILARMDHRQGAMPGRGDSTLMLIPRFAQDGPEREWLIEELNVAYIRRTVLPELMSRYLGGDYDIEVRDADGSAVFGANIDAPDGSVPLLDLHVPPGMARRGPPHFGPRPPEPDRGGPVGLPPGNFAGGRWRLLVRRHDGSLEALVERARIRNLSASAGLLLLILLTVLLLVRYSRQSQRLAEQQMNFVAGVSHELRTPLTVIRMAAYNLRGKLASHPGQVEKYGALIEGESEKLTELVEQVLRFASSEAGRVIYDREPVDVEALIDSSLPSAGAREKVTIERRLDPSLPRVLADKLALRHALQNLIENAFKYGGNWVGVFASAADHSGAVEIRVADRGPGIPADEQTRIFDPFFRGRRALSDQVHGTGLGLSLVKRIVEAHGGSIRVQSEPSCGTEFVVRIPAEPAA